MGKRVKLSNKTKRTKKELVNASKHIYWGMRYLSEKLELFLRFNLRKDKENFSGVVKSIHDAFLIDARRLIDFLFNSQTSNIHDDDVIAEYFFPDPNTWREIRPPLPDLLDKTKEDVNKLQAHYTYKMVHYPDGSITWKTSDVYIDIFNTMQMFLSNVDPSFLFDQFDYLRAENPKIAICKPVYIEEGGKEYLKIACTRDKASGIEIVEVD
jgi:hypothetical protein